MSNPDPTLRDWFLPIKPDPTNKELEDWSAEWLGWTMGEPEYVPGAPGATMRLWKGPNGEHTGFTENSWHPTKEGSEHQAMMVAERMLQLGWGCDIAGPVPGDPNPLHTVTFWWAFPKTADEDKEITVSEPTRGRAVLLAARRAVKGEEQG